MWHKFMKHYKQFNLLNSLPKKLNNFYSKKSRAGLFHNKRTRGWLEQPGKEGKEASRCRVSITSRLRGFFDVIFDNHIKLLEKKMNAASLKRRLHPGFTARLYPFGYKQVPALLRARPNPGLLRARPVSKCIERSTGAWTFLGAFAALGLLTHGLFLRSMLCAEP